MAPKNVSEEVADLLEAAWGRIDTPDKWIKNEYHSIDYSRHCSLGAIEDALDEFTEKERRKLRMQAVGALVDALPKYRGVDAPSDNDRVITYNDHPQVTHSRLKRYWFKAIANLRGPKNMDIKEIDVETTHEPLESPVPGKETFPKEIPATPTYVPTPDQEPAKV